jgi:hypothetical protein
MSLWTPGGEHPVDRGGSGSGSGGPGGGPEGPGDAPRLSAEQQLEAEQIAAEVQAVREQLAQVPAAMVIANHAMGCYELAAIHLSNQPPKLDEAKLAIDAFGALLGAVAGRLGPDEVTLNDALAQLRLAFVQVKASWEGGAEPAPADQPAQGDVATPDVAAEEIGDD